MNFKTLFKTVLITAGILQTHMVSSQSWSLTGNTGTNPASQFLGTTDANALKFRTNNTVRMTLNGTGKVGIGTSSPSALLHVQKSTLTDVLIKSTAAGTQLTLDRAANGFEAVVRYMQTGVPQWKTGLTVNANGTPDFIIRNEITNAEAINISGSNNFVNFPSGYITLGPTNSGSFSQSGNDMKLLPYSPSAGTPGNLLLCATTGLFNAGNVGIGTNAPTNAKLEVQGYVGQSVAMFKRSATSAGIAIAADWPEVYFNSYYNGGVKAMKAGYGALVGMDPTSGYMYFRTGNTAAGSNNGPLTLTDRMIIAANGRVLINNSLANSSFSVAKISGTDDIASFKGTTHYSHFGFGSNETTYIRGGLDNSAVVLADAGTQMVGIGTATPAYKLDVCGTMRAKEVRVSTGWCDYVFADDYELKPLSEVEAFIKENKHLPEVTPGAIIESEGLEVGQTSAQMIKKIEELTLYVIDLQKQIDNLKKNNR